MCKALWLRSMLSSQPSRGASAEQRRPLPLFISVNQQRTLFCLFNITHSFSSKGHWDLVHESYNVIDNIFSPFLKGEHTNFCLSSVHLQKCNLCFWYVAGLVAAGWDLKRNLLDWDEWRVEWKIKNKWTPAISRWNKKRQSQQLYFQFNMKENVIIVFTFIVEVIWGFYMYYIQYAHWLKTGLSGFPFSHSCFSARQKAAVPPFVRMEAIAFKKLWHEKKKQHPVEKSKQKCQKRSKNTIHQTSWIQLN